MKMSKILALLMVALMVVAAFAACTTTPGTGDETTDAGTQGGEQTTAGTENNGPTVDEIVEAYKGTYEITMWVSELDGVAALTQQQIDAFEAKYPGIVINASIEGVTEADAGSKVVADVATASHRTSSHVWFRQLLLQLLPRLLQTL